MRLASFVCLRAWTGPDGKGARFGSTQGGWCPPPLWKGSPPPPPRLQPPQTVEHPSGSHIGWRRPPCTKQNKAPGTAHLQQCPRSPVLPAAASPPCIPLGGFEPLSSGQQPAAQPLQCEAQNLSHRLPTLSKSSSRGWAPSPLPHSQFVLNHVRRIGTNGGTATPHTLPPKHTILVQVTWPRSASTRKVTRVKDGSIRVSFSVL